MAQAIGNFIDRIQIGNDDPHQIAIGSSAYGICNTNANEPSKTVNIPGFTLNPGTTIHVKFTNTNTASNPTLNISNTGAKGIVIYGSTTSGADGYYTGWQAGAVLTLTYDGTNWVRNQGFNEIEIPNVIVKTTAEWQAMSSYIPSKDTILIYSDYGSITINNVSYNVPGIKIADGLAYGIDQPFVGEDVKTQVLSHINNSDIHITSTERTFWNNKLNCDISGEVLILNHS